MASKIIKITRKLEKNRRKKREELLDVLLKKEIQNQSFKGKKHKKKHVYNCKREMFTLWTNNKILFYKYFSKKNKEKHKIKIKMIEDHYNKIIGVNERSNYDVL